MFLGPATKFRFDRFCLHGHHVCWWGGIAGFVLLCLFAGPCPVEAKSGENTPPVLSEQVLDQLRMLKAEKQSRTPVQRKISSRLLHAQKSRKGSI